MSIKVAIEAQYDEFVSASKKLGEFYSGVMDGMKAELKDMSDAAKEQMKGHESATEQFANILKSNMSGVSGAVEGVKIAWAQLAVVFGAGAFLKSTVDKTLELTQEAQKLGRTLGISATEASRLSVAIGDAYGTTDEYIKLTKGLDAQLKRNEKGMQEFGLETRNADGSLKDQQTLMMDALETLRGYKAGTDRNIAASKLFGAGVDVTSEMLSLNAEALAEATANADAYGLTVGEDDVEASNAFRGAMNDINDTIDAMMKAIGQALLPILVDFGQWLAEYGPAAMLVTRVAIDMVISVFRGLALAVKVVWEVVKLAFNNMTTMATGFANVFTSLFKGDFEGAANAARGVMDGMGTNIAETFDRIVNQAADTGSAITDMWAKTINGPGPVKDSGVEGAVGTEDADITKPGKKGKDTSAADERKRLAEEKRAIKEAFAAKMEGYRAEEQAAQDNLTTILSIQMKELEAVKAMYGEESKEYERAQGRIEATKRRIVEQQERMDARAAESHRTIALMQIDEDEAMAEARQQMGEITVQELIAQELEFAEQRYMILRQALLDEAVANVDRVEEHQNTLLKLEELDAQHHGRVAALTTAATMDRVQMQLKSEDIIAGSLSQGVMGLINKTMTWKQAVLSTLASITQGFLQMFANWAAKQAAHYIMDRVMHGKNLIAKKIAEKAATASSIGAAAGIAGANGVASFALAPWPINMGAPAFGAAMAAAATGFGALAVAEQGYDVPAGVNPLTQLHEQEMVLPKEYANVIRGMDGNSGGSPTFHFHAVDADSFRRLVMDNASFFTDALRQQSRDFKF